MTIKELIEYLNQYANNEETCDYEVVNLGGYDFEAQNFKTIPIQDCMLDREKKALILWNF